MNSVEDNAAKQYELPKWEFNRNADPKEIDLQNKIIVLSRAGTDFQLICSTVLLLLDLQLIYVGFNSEKFKNFHFEA